MTLTTRRFELSVTLLGKPTCPPLLLLHGFLGEASDWLGIAQQLASRYFVIIPDIPGHGATRLLPQPSTPHSTEPYSLESVAGTILELLAALKQDRTYLCGYSMGGRLALYLALRHPTRFQAACILSSTAGLRTDEERKVRCLHDEEIARKLETMPLPEFLEFWYSQALFTSFRQHPQFAQATMRRREMRTQEAAASLRGMGTGAQTPLWDILSTNRVPITFVAGERDAKFVALAQEMQVNTPFSSLAIIPNAGHVLHYEAGSSVQVLLEKIFT
ncbi:MAG: 2-succinyl-6-hydroxy-2,4-cyclohexadiene-1-carboxylate synthase [Candidatus Kapaibacterium sp.]|nr:MAG: 2-succinyl-6-hydroxy-2,4-cyclohexadiene-1-carboxylate synthase [Candidatus Kapabacteria bacterium]